MATPPDFSPGQVLTAAHMDAVGLWLIDSVSVTSGSTISISDCFSSEFVNYRLVISDLKTSGNNGLTFQLMSSGTPAATNYSYGHGYILFSAAVWNLAAANNTATAWVAPGNTFTNPPANGVIDLYQPFEAERTGMTGQYQSFDAYVVTGGVHNLANSYDGFQFVSTGTFTSGTVRVYGYRN